MDRDLAPAAVRTLIRIGISDLISQLMNECTLTSVDDALTQITNKLRYDPAVYEFTRAYDEWLKKLPSDDYSLLAPDAEHYFRSYNESR